ncbi:PP2C family protein-serine/threonine phosphatase [Streptomyces sp. NPDC005181]|uniref:PP2C family protein-serine/threonine phosphatase n=1 Tax=Streptomyces sp. NPDC005181 TaxID=3156869 RepID=UPI0033A874AF
MGLTERVAGLRESWRPGHALLVIPVVLIAAITAVDILLPQDIYLGPLLVIAPAITASFEGPALTGVIGLLAVAAQAYISLHSGVLTSRNALVQIGALTMLSALIVFFCLIRERHSRQLARVRSVAETAQNVLLRPLPARIGPLRIASLYLAAEDEALIGGDLYAATRIEGGTRVMIGDVRGQGLAAIGEAALLLGAFREASYQYNDLPTLAAALDQSVARYHADVEPEDEDQAGERFVTALLLEIPDERRISRMTSCGHPAPLLLSQGHAVTVPSLHPAPPLGIGEMGPAGYTTDVFAFEAGDALLLFTDGVIEARDRGGDFYPLAERAAQWTESPLETLLHHLRCDLLAHVGGRLGDDAAVIAIHRNPILHPGRCHGDHRP